MGGDIFYIILGFVIIYFVVHFVVIQFMRSWKDRSSYEKFVTIVALVFIVLVFAGTSTGS